MTNHHNYRFSNYPMPFKMYTLLNLFSKTLYKGELRFKFVDSAFASVLSDVFLNPKTL